MRSLLLLAASLATFLLTGVLRAEPPQQKPSDSSVGYTLSGPYTHDNLSIYLIHGRDTLTGKPYLSLQQAMEQKIVVVHETGDVNELAIENVSPDIDVYIQSGDIVKGGQQDRTFTYDFILPPKSGKTAIAAFCVEQGRWSQREAESVSLFGGSINSISGKEMKMAAKARESQQEVWANVHAQQATFALRADAAVTSTTSPSSYALTLESKKLDDITSEYDKDLSNITHDQADVVGYAFAINGKMNNVDIYTSHDLFMQLWPKLLKSSIVEAVQDKNGQKFEAPAKEAVTAVIDDAEKARAEEKSVSDRTTMTRHESKDNIGFDTADKARDNLIVHRNYLTKDGTEAPLPSTQPRSSLDQWRSIPSWD